MQVTVGKDWSLVHMALRFPREDDDWIQISGSFSTWGSQVR